MEVPEMIKILFDTAFLIYFIIMIGKHSKRIEDLELENTHLTDTIREHEIELARLNGEL